MDYKDQLVITGELNDVGATLRSNVPESYRAGIEAEVGFELIEKVDIYANATFSQNKIATFEGKYTLARDCGTIEGNGAWFRSGGIDKNN